MVPWHIHEYSKNELKSLFDLYWSTYNVLDHSPKATWDVLQQNVNLDAVTSRETFIDELFKYARSYRHGGNLDPDLGVVTVTDMAAGGGYQNNKIARSGCWSMVPFYLVLAQALNVPGEIVVDYFAGNGHATASFPITNQVLAHGDNPYNSLLGNTPAATALDSYDRWAAEVLRYKARDGEFSAAGVNSRTHNYKNARLYPSNYLMKGYCDAGAGASGREYLEKMFIVNGVVFASVEELDDLETRIQATTYNCSFVPDNDPEAQEAPE